MKCLIRAVFFDLDETLYDYGSIRKVANQEVAKLVEKMGLTSSETFIQTLRLVTREVYEKYRESPLLFDRKYRFKEIFRVLEIDVNEETVARLVNQYWNYVYQHIKPYTDVIPVLETLKAKGYKLGIISDGLVEIQINRVKALNLHKYFDTYTFSEEVGKNKPSSEIFQLALKRTRCKPSEAVMVGDNVKTDIAGANKVGMISVWVRRGIFKNIKPDNPIEIPNYTITDLNELISILDHL